MTITYLSTGDKLAARALRSARRSTGHLGQLARMTGAAVKTEVSASNTGDWKFLSDAHVVRLGNRFHTNIEKLAGWSRRSSPLHRNDRHAVAFATQILRHEKWHGLATVRDVPALAAACRRDGVPFAVFNILEDIRIEWKAKTVESEWFFWVNWVGIHSAKNAIHAILNLKMAENSGWGSQWSAPDTDLVDLDSFFSRSRNAADSWEVIKLAKEFVERFGTDAPPPETVTKGQLHDDIGDDNDGSAGGTATRSGAIPDAPSAEADAHIEVDDNGEVVMPKGTPKTNTKQVHWTDFAGGV
jgi:hypothetical protein